MNHANVDSVGTARGRISKTVPKLSSADPSSSCTPSSRVGRHGDCESLTHTPRAHSRDTSAITHRQRYLSRSFPERALDVDVRPVLEQHLHHLHATGSVSTAPGPRSHMPV